MSSTTFDKRETLKVKGIAICMLIFHHLFYSPQRVASGGVNFPLLPQQLVTSIAIGMRICVWVFAFLSAYGLTKQYLKIGSSPSAKERLAFVKKHWLSMMMPYWLIFLIVSVLSAVVYRDVLKLFGGNITSFLLCAFGISDLFGTTMPVAAWWYMCLAQLLILFLPFGVELCRKFGWLTLFASVFVLPNIGAGIVSNFGGSYLNYVFVIILGILCAQHSLFETILTKPRHWALCLLEGFVLIVVVILCITLNIKYSSGDTWRITKLLMALAAGLICLLSYHCISNRHLESILTFLGKHSGNIFLIHAFTYTYWLELTYWSHNVGVTFFTVLCISILCSVFCQFLMKRISLTLQHIGCKKDSVLEK